MADVNQWIAKFYDSMSAVQPFIFEVYPSYFSETDANNAAAQGAAIFGAVDFTVERKKETIRTKRVEPLEFVPNAVPFEG